ncbi:MAG: S-layer homology domain-containing protein [Chloroflexia bacterium]
MSKWKGTTLTALLALGLIATTLIIGGSEITQASAGVGSIAAPKGTSIATATPTGTPSCDVAWRVVYSPDTGPLSDRLSGVSAIAANDAWAVGHYVGENGYDNMTLVQHWNGVQWETVPSPNVGPDPLNNQLRGVSALAPDDVWAVGYFYGLLYVPHTLVQHWDGNQWSIVPSPDGDSGANYLNGVSALASDDVWAVGYSYPSCCFTPRTLTLHWNGSRWDVVPSPNIGSTNSNLTAVTAIAPDDAWAVGHYFDESANTLRTLIEHWDGSVWSIVPSPNAGVESDLEGVFALAADNVWAVGRYSAPGPDQTLVLHWDGSVWSIVPSPNAGSLANNLFGVAGSGPNDVWAVGSYFDENKTYTLLLHWDGNVWSMESSPSPGSLINELRGVSAVSANDVWAVGNSYNGAGSGEDTQTLIERYSDSCAAPAPTSTPLITPTACTLSFTDVPEDSTFYPYIRCLSCMGIINGYTSGCETGDPCFRPGNNVTRGQITKVVSNAAAFSDPPGMQMFEDVPPGHTFYTYTQRLATRGFITGYPCGGPGEPCVPPDNRPYFRPGYDITRGQLAKIVSNAAGFGGIPGFQLFEDVPPDHTFYTYTQMLGHRQIMRGYRCGSPSEPCVPPYERTYFRPDNNATRGQTAKIVANAFFPDCNPLAR